MSHDSAAPVHLSIGEVLSFIQQEFPDVTISKIRFLESQGLIQPDRTASGYRKFYESDIERLQWILRQQRDHFLPLKVIRKMLDDGVDRFDPGGGPQPTLWTPTKDEEPPEPEPAALSSGPPRSPAHPAVASAPAEAESRRPASTGSVQATRPVVPPDRPFGARSDEQPFRRSTQQAPVGAAATTGSRSAASPSSSAGGSGRRRPGPLVPPGPTGVGRAGSRSTGRGPVGPGAAAGAAPDRPAGATPDAGPGPRDTPLSAGPTPRPPLETPADVVAALQEDPRSAQRDSTPGRRGHRGRSEPPGGSTPTGGRKPARSTVDPDTALNAVELCQDAAIDDRLLADLEQFGLIEGHVRTGERVYGPEALVVARLAARYADLGVGPRHLRMYLVSAEREAGLVEQLAVPILKQRNPQARSQAAALASELASMGSELHGALLRRGLGPDLAP